MIPVTNPRFPHRITVTRMPDPDVAPLSTTPIVLLDSECRIMPSRNGSTAMTDGVYISDYTVSMPLHFVDIKAGDLVLAVDLVKTIIGTVVNSHPSNLGATLWFDKA